MTFARWRLGLPLALSLAMLAVPATSGQPLYVLESAQVLPSTDTDWDYLKLEPGRARLFIALDASTGRQITAIPIGRGVDGKAPAPYFHPNSFTVLTYKPM